MTLMHFTDRVFLSWSSPQEIAASLPAGILLFTILSFFLGISEYTNTFVAQYYGADRRSFIALATWQGVFFSLFGGLSCLLLLPLGLRIFDWAGHAPDIVILEKLYFSYLFAGGTFFLLKESLSSFYSGRGKTKVILWVNIVANLINAFLDYGLIFGAWGFPQWGIKGAAIATVASTVFACAIFAVLFISPHNNRAYHTRKAMRFDWAIMKRLLRFGAPSGMQFFLDISSFGMFIFLIGRLGIVELTASNIALSINHLAWFPMIGAGVATATMVGQYIGRKDLRTAEKSAYSALLAVVVYMLCFALLYFTIPTYLFGIFRGGEGAGDAVFSEAMKLSVPILMLMALFQISDAMIITFSGALRGAGDTKFAMWAAACFAWMFFVPGTWIALNVLDRGVISAWIWATIYITVLGIVFLLRFRSGFWKKIRVMHE